MPHLRPRAIEPEITHVLKHSPCLGLIGMRQVGKSTLLKKFARRYYSFDQAEFAARFEREGATILDSPGYPLALDEVQKHPPAFDTLKYAIDNLKKPGRFLLSGSVRFASRRQIRESLTGRIFLLEMFPLTLSECHSKPLSPFLSLLRDADDRKLVDQLKKRAWATPAQIQHYLEAGGLPGICFLRDPSLRERHFENHLDTLLGRDIQLVRQVKLTVTRLKTLLTELARNQGRPCSVAELARVAGCSQPTAKAVLDALEGLFLIRAFGKTYFLEDTGLSHFFIPLGKTLTRFDQIRLLYHEFRAQNAYRLQGRVSITPFATRGGLDVPFVIKYKFGERIALMVDEEELPSDKSVKGLTWFRKRHPQSRSIILCRTQKPFHTATGVLCLPWTWIF